MRKHSSPRGKRELSYEKSNDFPETQKITPDKKCSRHSTGMHPARIADTLTKFFPQDIVEVLSVVKPRTRAAIFSYLAQP
jgi:hypothetical protein